MKITELKENQVVHCKTHEEAKRVLKLADEAGMKWCTNKSYIKYDMWNTYKDKTCYKFTNGSFGTIPYFKSEDFEIISSEKITDNKTEFFEERVMEVSSNNVYWRTGVVFAKKNGFYLAWNDAETIREAGNKVDVMCWEYAREIDPFRELKKAYARGEDIQYRYKGGGWIDTPVPDWDEVHEYRIKPKSKYVPFTFEDAEKLIGKAVKSVQIKRVATITDVLNDAVFIGRCDEFSFNGLFEYFTFLDGSPCGKEVEE